MIEIILFLILLSISILLIKRRFEHRSDRSNKSQTLTIPLLTKIPEFFKKHTTLLIIILIVGLIWLYYWYDTSPDEVYTFSNLQEFQKNWQVVSGNWQVKNGYLEGYGEIQLKNSEVLDFGAIKVWPASREFLDLTVDIGLYNFRYFQGMGGLSYWQDEIVHRSEIFYNKDIEITYIGGVLRKVNDKPLPIKVSRSWWDWLYIPKDPQVEIGDWKIASGLRLQEITPEQVKGKIKISSRQSVQISKIEIFYNSYGSKFINRLGL